MLLCVDGVHGFGVETERWPTSAATSSSPAATSGCSARAGPGSSGERAGVAVPQPTIPTFDGRVRGVDPGRAPTAAGRRDTPGGFHSFEHRWALPRRSPSTGDRAAPDRRAYPQPRAPAEGRLGCDPSVRLHTPLDERLSAGSSASSCATWPPGMPSTPPLRARGRLSVTPYAPSTFARPEHPQHARGGRPPARRDPFPLTRATHFCAADRRCGFERTRSRNAFCVSAGVRLMMRFGLLVAAVLAGVLGIGAGAAGSPRPPPGAAMSPALEYLARTPDAAGIEGKFDGAGGRDVLVVTGGIGFGSIDVGDPADPQALDTFQPPEVLGRERLLAGRGHGARHPAQADHRRARSRATTTSTSRAARASGSSAAQDPQPEVPLGLLRHLLRRPGGPAAGRPLRRGAQQATPRAASRTAATSGRAAGAPRRPGRSRARSSRGGRGDGRPIWVTDLRDPAKPGDVRPADRPEAQRRRHGLLARRRRGRAGVAWISGRGGLLGYATRAGWRNPQTDRVRRAKPWDPVLVAGGGVPGGPTASPSPSRTSSTTRSGRRRGAWCVRGGPRTGNVGARDRGGLHGPCELRAAGSWPWTSRARWAARVRPTRRPSTRSG